ncbi:dolichyl-phosphate-mannose-protein mannosyltransferase/NHL repeat [Longilinea arvoryzae]|uniref:Dolichyl-phosphate-mannose-protein mannosyltransferase/NHL repeat n=1 Tax=Longilinea arvoryzae TaxID=360412 RepID=A0A0S7BN24_9CHLR|nr:SMP-30/gluconolactonase/LRE family protein [Longilinea arvoryzae]GAP15361.1 dolichyl-phosphate-mannose-protein mannosyltransferase/NHL repeat [Longilinea arvoryzae]
MEKSTEKSPAASWLDRPVFRALPQFRVETLLIVLILIAAIFTRFYNIDLRVMSHDETNHVRPAWDYYQGRGYNYDPVTHGPFQFHVLAASYFLLGDSDFSARAPYALFSIATIAVGMLAFKRYLGQRGALFAGAMMLISPILLFYGRYTRNEAFEGLWTVLMIYGILRYLEKGEKSALILLTIVSAFHFSDKATSYIYTAQALMFLALFFLDQVTRLKWPEEATRKRFILLMGIMIVMVVVALGAGVASADASTTPLQSNATTPQIGSLSLLRGLEYGGLVLALVAGLAAVVTLVRSLGWKVIRKQRSFDLIMLLMALVIPLLAAFPVRMVGWNPLDYSTSGMLHTALFLVPMVAIGVALGLWWRPRIYLTCLAIFSAIFTVLYTSFFTNGQGFFMGLIASLGYWLSQQGVQRGSQPLYYYALIQIPIYEYLPAIGALVALYFGLRYRRFMTWAGFSPAHQPEDGTTPETKIVELDEAKEPSEIEPDEPALAEAEDADNNLIEAIEEPHAAQRVPVLALLLFWTFTSLVAYSLAGEKMPWLTLHIATPMILAAGWGFGYLADTTDWKRFGEQKGWLALLLLPVFVASAAGLFASTMGGQLPFQGKELAQLQATSDFVLSLAGLVLSGWGIVHLLRDVHTGQLLRIFASAFLVLLSVLTARTAFTASYINYDLPTEFLVYAHGGNGPKQMLAQIEEISRRTTDGLGVQIAYDEDGIYPFWWYLRDYTNVTYYKDTPTRDLRDKAIVIVSDNMYSRVEPILKDNFIYYQYQRLWWPMQDYFNLTWDRVWSAISNPQMRQALFDIWLNRDYTKYAELEGRTDLTLENWYPSAGIRLYIRKDIVSQIWNYGAAPVAPVTEVDPYESGKISLSADLSFGTPGSAEGQLNTPRGLAVAADGTIYVADSHNNRIEHFSADGQLLQQWGGFTDISQSGGTDGMFYEPWGVAVGPDGSVYVTDTWNHRVQKFTADGKFITKWGYFGTAETPDAFWGPRGIAVDSQGRVYVADTGNKRISVFTSDGKSITQFGGQGFEAGKFDEPVGVAVDSQGLVYVTDTWNQRIQVFSPTPTGDVFVPLLQWDVSAWYGESLDNKPFIAVSPDGNVFVNDPEGYRILEFKTDGTFVRTWGDPGAGAGGFGMPAGVALDSEGHVWVSDAINNSILRFTLP